MFPRGLIESLTQLTGQLFNLPELENHVLKRTCQSQEFSNTLARDKPVEFHKPLSSKKLRIS